MRGSSLSSSRSGEGPAAGGADVSSRGDDPERPQVTIVLGTLNEVANLPMLLEEIERVLSVAYEIIVVDDGSTDGTREFLKARARADPRVRPILNDSKQTTLRAHYQALGAVRGEFVIVMDSDLQHPAGTLPALVAEWLGGADVVVASRYLPGGSTGNRRAFRGLVSRVAAQLARSIVPPSRALSDPMSGFFGIATGKIRSGVPPHRGYKILLYLLSVGPPVRMREVPYTFLERGTGDSKVVSGFRFLRTYLRELREDHRAWITVGRGRRTTEPALLVGPRSDRPVVDSPASPSSAGFGTGPASSATLPRSFAPAPLRPELDTRSGEPRPFAEGLSAAGDPGRLKSLP